MKFHELKLIPPLLKAVKEAGYEIPSPIQEQAIPPVLEGRDLLGCAQTGTGKTAAFALPILQILAKNKLEKKGADRPIRALILTPTRELALQIFENFRAYSKFIRVRSTVIFGGVSQDRQVNALSRGTDILIATPGRLHDLIGQGYIDITNLEILVLDEADRMLDMGFIHDIQKVLEFVPEDKQTLLFSATMPKEIQHLVDGLLQDPVKISVAPQSTAAETVTQYVYFTEKKTKQQLLVEFLMDDSISSALVFTRTKRDADRISKALKTSGIQADSIHGDKSQSARQKALSRFKNGELRILVATDIAARGIDVDELPYVVNYNIPNISETYIHRIGRTGRAGLSGTAISFCDGEELEFWRDIEKLLGRKVERKQFSPYTVNETELDPNLPKKTVSKSHTKQSNSKSSKPQNKPQKAANGNTKKSVNTPTCARQTETTEKAAEARSSAAKPAKEMTKSDSGAKKAPSANNQNNTKQAGDSVQKTPTGKKPQRKSNKKATENALNAYPAKQESSQKASRTPRKASQNRMAKPSIKPGLSTRKGYFIEL